MTTIKRETLSDRIRELVAQDIVSGNLKPGQRLLPAEVAERYDVSLIPVREALRALEAAGFVVSQANRAMYVKALSKEELHQVLVVRKSLEALAIAEAIEHTDEEHLGDLRELISRMDAVDDNEEWLSLNREFHLGIYSVTENKLLLDLIVQMWTKMEPYLRVYGVSVGDLTGPKREHEALVEALEARDLDEAIKIQNSHIMSAGRIVERVLADDEWTGGGSA